jgi:hypothetical protein
MINDLRMDAPDTLFFQREREAIDSRLYEVKLPLLKARELLPTVSDIAETDKAYTYRMVKTQGKAKIIADKTTDMPMVNAQATEHTVPIEDLALGYQYSVMEVKAAAALRRPLDDTYARAARRGIAEQIDDMLATTRPGRTFGFIDHPEVDDTFNGFAAAWDNTTDGDEMVAQMNSFVNGFWDSLKDAPFGNGQVTLVMPAPKYSLLASTPMGDNADKTALTYLLSNNPYLERVVPWHRLTGAGDSSADRAIVYIRDPEVLGAIVPREFTPLPFQQVGLQLVNPVIAACGGIALRYPVAVRYGDGL